MLAGLFAVFLYRDGRRLRVRIAHVRCNRPRAHLVREVSSLADDLLAGLVYDEEVRILVSRL